MVAVGAFFWLYAVKPRLLVIRALPYFWRGNLPPAPEWRAFAALAGTLLLAAAASSDHPFSAREVLKPATSSPHALRALSDLQGWSDDVQLA